MNKDCENCKYAELPMSAEVCVACYKFNKWEPDDKLSGRKLISGLTLEETIRCEDGPWEVYLAGSLRNENIPQISQYLAESIEDCVVFSDWFAAGPEADDYWKRYYEAAGFSYKDALRQPASVNTFNFDKRNMENAKTMVLALPAGKSGHLELGWFLGQGKPGYILLDNPDRWDVMYQFATGVTDDIEELAEWIKKDLGR